MSKASRIAATVEQMRASPAGIRFPDLMEVCEHYFGAYRQKGSHRIFTTGDVEQPLLTLQPRRKMAKPYQVRQVVKALTRKESR